MEVMNKWSFGEIGRDEWDAFENASAQANLLQAAARDRVREKMGYETWILGVKDENGQILAGALILVRGGVAWAAYGPILDWSDRELAQFYLSGLEKFAEKQGWLALELYPYEKLRQRSSKGEILEEYACSDIIELLKGRGFSYDGETTAYDMKANRWMFVKNLTGIENVEDLRRTYRKTLRARLRKTEGKLSARVLSREDLGEMEGLIDASDARHGVKGRDLDYYKYIYDSFGEDVEFVVADVAGTQDAAAGALFIWHGEELISFLSGMRWEYRDLGGRAWLQDYMMQRCLEKDIRRVNFYWVEGKFEKNSLLEFKSGFGGEIEEYLGKFTKILRPGQYRLRMLRGKLGRSLRSLKK